MDADDGDHVDEEAKRLKLRATELDGAMGTLKMITTLRKKF